MKDKKEKNTGVQTETPVEQENATGVQTKTPVDLKEENPSNSVSVAVRLNSFDYHRMMSTAARLKMSKSEFMKFAIMDYLEDKTSTLEQLKEAQGREVLLNKKLADSIQLKESTKKILSVVVDRLVKQTKDNTITADEIVNNMILRYNIEQFNYWFYPFVIDYDEIEKITGKGRREWMRDLRVKNLGV